MGSFFLNANGQAQPEKTVQMTERDFRNNGNIAVYWLGGGGAMINSFGTILMIDPLLEGFDMPLLLEAPVRPEDVPRVDGCFISHVDNDHYSRATVRKLKGVTGQFHASHYVASLMAQECGVEAAGHTWYDRVDIGDVSVTVTPADHNWPSEFDSYSYRVWDKKEYSGFYVRTHGKKIWYVGDSRLMEEQLHMEAPDVILFDFSDNPYHIGLKNACLLANTYPDAALILVHWGTVDAPTQSPFNGNPQDILNRVENPGRVVILAPGEPYILT